MQMEKVIQFAKKQGYETVKKLSPWNGYEVYEPIMNEKEVSFIGPPLLILVKGETIRMSTEEEAFKQMDDAENGLSKSHEVAKTFNELINKNKY